MAYNSKTYLIKVDCPACQGTGKVEMKDKSIKQVQVYCAKILLKKGLSIRQIGKAMGYKSSNGIAYLLNNKHETKEPVK